MNEPFEAKGELGAAVATEGGLDGLEMIQHRPKELISHLRIAREVGVRKRVLGRRRGISHRRQRPGVKLQRVTHLEAEAVGDLGVEQADDMAPGTERAGLLHPRRFHGPGAAPDAAE